MTDSWNIVLTSDSLYINEYCLSSENWVCTEKLLVSSVWKQEVKDIIVESFLTVWIFIIAICLLMFFCKFIFYLIFPKAWKNML